MFIISNLKKTSIVSLIIIISTLLLFTSAYSDLSKEEIEQARQKAHTDFLKNAEKLKLPGTGNVLADTVIYDFMDYNCGYCRKMGALLIKASKEKDIRIVYVDSPILSDTSITAASYVIAAQNQGKYMQAHDGIYNLPSISTLSLDALFEGLGLNMEKVKKDINDNTVYAILNRNLSIFRSLQATGTPYLLIVNNATGKANVIAGYTDYASLVKTIDGLK